MRLILTVVTALLLSIIAPTAAHGDSDYTYTIGRWPVSADKVCAQSTAPLSWDVTEAIDKWNAQDKGQPKLLLRDDCANHRVTVKQVYKEDETWGGKAFVDRNEDGTLKHVTVELNRYRVVIKHELIRNDYRTFVTVHEFGHVLGLYHPPDGINSIMAGDYDYVNRPRVPTSVDWRDLARTY